MNGASRSRKSEKLMEMAKPQPETPEQMYKLTPEVLEGLEANHRRRMDTCLAVLQEAEGFVTPAESFIQDLLIMYEAKSGLTAEVIESELDEFRGNIELATKCARKMLRDYPDLVKGDAE